MQRMHCAGCMRDFSMRTNSQSIVRRSHSSSRTGGTNPVAGTRPLVKYVETVPRHLMHGDSVSFESTGPENEKDISAQSITRLKILFRPSTKLKDKISGTSLVRQ